MDTCFSGGAEGADQEWGKCAEKAGHNVVHYGFAGIGSRHKVNYILLEDELKEADSYIEKADKLLKRGNFTNYSNYVKNILRRNWWQVSNSERVYAVAPLNIEDGTVRGGTGWAVQNAIDMHIPEVYLFDMPRRIWYRYDGTLNGIQMWVNEWGWKPPKPYGNYTGIGSREITDAGLEAIRKVYE